MQNKHLYTLLDTTYTTIKVVFGKVAHTKPRQGMEINLSSGEFRVGELDAKQPQSWTYKVRKDSGIKVDDAVIVESPQNGLQIVRVVEVHDTPQIDLDAPFEYKWIIQRVDRTEHDEQVAKERQFNDTMLEVERTRIREETLNNMRQHLPEGSEARKLFDQAQALLPNAPLKPADFEAAMRVPPAAPHNPS